MGVLMRLLVATCILLAVATARADPGAAPDRPILVIVAIDSTLNGMSFDGLRRIFSGQAPETRPLNLPSGSPERVAFDLIVLGRNPDDVARFWIDRKIRGQGEPPRVIPNERLLAKIIARVPGTIGYLVNGPLPPGVRVLRIGGLAPEDPRYPLILRSKPR